MEPIVARKNGEETLLQLLAIAYHVLEETKHMNLKPPLRPISKLFAVDVAASGSPLSESETPQDEVPLDLNGLTTSFAGTHAHSSVQGHFAVIPFLSEEVQDTYTRIAMLKTQYMKLSTELLEAVKETEKKTTNSNEGMLQDKEDAMIAKLVVRRNQLRKEVYERNIVMKGLIDRLRNLQHAIRLTKGGSAYPPNIVMESV
ncbi:unnamed protein product [Peronospora belbahrii]|uniref:Uncharacterized protein n=1 Tax=Peronospora belbahrii TaxID=622444 RepID=A0AAU9LA70_9STRA|nr:unnamed protein product [Peronospora belbahrii]